MRLAEQFSDTHLYWNIIQAETYQVFCDQMRSKYLAARVQAYIFSRDNSSKLLVYPQFNSCYLN